MNRLRLGADRLGSVILPMFSVGATQCEILFDEFSAIYCIGPSRAASVFWLLRFLPANGAAAGLSQPPGGDWASVDASMCGWADQASAAARAAARVERSRRLAISSRFFAASASPSRAAMANHL